LAEEGKSEEKIPKAEGREGGKEEAKSRVEGEEVAIFTIPLGDLWKESRWRRTPKALRILKSFILRHLKMEPESLRISQDLNKILWMRGIEKPPRRIRVRVMRDKEGVYTLYPVQK
jgi:large subunit ribosomal protein L31e